MVTTTKFEIERNGQKVWFTHNAGTVGEDLADIEQVSDYTFRGTGEPKPLLDYLLDGVHVHAADLGLARQAKKTWEEWGADIKAQQAAQPEVEAKVAARQAYDAAWAELQAAKQAARAYAGPRIAGGTVPTTHPEYQPFVARMFRANAHLNVTRAAYERLTAKPSCAASIPSHGPDCGCGYVSI